jgi:hypothetical protein
VRGEIHSIDPPGEDEPAADVFTARYSGDRFVTDSPLEEAVRSELVSEGEIPC